MFSREETCQKHLLALVEEQLSDKQMTCLMNKIKNCEPEIYYHSLNVAYRAAEICQKMNLGSIDTKNIVNGALLHDFGKIFLDKKILKKEKFHDKLNRMEFEEYKNYPQKGCDYLHNLGFNDAVLDSVLYHREMINGKGFPCRATDIPIEAVIVRIADKYEALIMEGLSNNAALHIELNLLASQLGCYDIIEHCLLL